MIFVLTIVMRLSSFDGLRSCTLGIWPDPMERNHNITGMYSDQDFRFHSREGRGFHPKEEPFRCLLGAYGAFQGESGAAWKRWIGKLRLRNSG